MMAAVQAEYDRIGLTYSRTRRTDQRLFQLIDDALGDAATVANVGAGTGSYESPDRRVTAFEPSAAMIAQRPRGSAPAVRAVAESLPADDDSFDAAMAILTIHHWADWERGLLELRRVATGPVVVVTFDPVRIGRWWIADYAPGILNEDRGRFPPTASIERLLGGGSTKAVPIPADFKDLFLGAIWSRPELMLDPRFRAATSGFARLDDDTERHAVDALRQDLASGEWDRRWGELRKLDSFDVGVRLVRSP